jgi:hypothetical protein
MKAAADAFAARLLPKKHCFSIGPIGEQGSPERAHAVYLYKGITSRIFATKLKSPKRHDIRCGGNCMGEPATVSRKWRAPSVSIRVAEQF